VRQRRWAPPCAILWALAGAGDLKPEGLGESVRRTSPPHRRPPRINNVLSRLEAGPWSRRALQRLPNRKAATVCRPARKKIVAGLKRQGVFGGTALIGKGAKARHTEREITEHPRRRPEKSARPPAKLPRDGSGDINRVFGTFGRRRPPKKQPESTRNGLPRPPSGLQSPA